MNKLDIILSDLKKFKADAAIITSEYNRFWFTNFWSSAGYLIINESNQYFLVDNRYFNAAKVQINNAEVLSFTSIQDLKDLLNKMKIQTLLVEKEYTNLKQLELYWKMSFETVGVESRKWRIIKDNSAILALSQAAKIAAKAIEWIRTQNIIGKTEIEVAKMITIHMIELGATSNSFDLIVATGKNGAIPHHQPDNTILEEGNLVTIDIGCMYDHYASDITRTFALGNKIKNPILEKIYNVVLESNLRGIRHIKANVYGDEIDKICRNYISSFDEFKDYFTHATGHGVGLEVHELPYVSLRSHNILPLNSVCTVEPGIYIPEIGGVRIEDTILVKEDGPIVLTEFASKKLFN